ncbi:MAG: hypothetical protein ACF8MJ_07825, partial [Phycisphaerales bacterium JB050]
PASLIRSVSDRIARSAGVLVLAAACAGFAPDAIAQQLPPVSTERLSSAQQNQVREYVEERLEILESDAVSQAEGARARRELIEPMLARDTSVAMRQAFASAASDRLADLVANGNEQQAVSALLVAGSIADRSSIEILRRGLNDEREAVEIGAAAGAKAMVRVLDGRLGGAQAQRQREVQDLLADRLGITQSGYAAQSIIGALTALPENAAFLSVSGVAIADEMTGQVLLRRGGNDPASVLISGGWDGAMERALTAQLAFQRASAISGVDVSRDTQLQSARLAGISLSLVRDALDELDATGADDAEIRAFLSKQERLIRSAESLLILVDANLSGSNRAQGIGRLIESGDVDDLIDAMNAWVGSRGVLTGAPYSMDESDLGN